MRIISPLLVVALSCGGPGGVDRPAPVSAPGARVSVPTTPPVAVPPLVGGIGTCVGFWELRQGATTRTNCPASEQIASALIIDIDAGRYRARLSDGGRIEVLSASAPDQPCRMSLEEFWHVDAQDSSYEVRWDLAPSGSTAVYEDLDAWNACEHAFVVDADRRDLRASDVAFDAQRAAQEFLTYWRQSCAPHYVKLPAGTGDVQATLELASDGQVERLLVGAADVWFACTKYRCACPDLTNASGSPQRVVVTLPRR